MCQQSCESVLCPVCVFVVCSVHILFALSRVYLVDRCRCEIENFYFMCNVCSMKLWCTHTYAHAFGHKHSRNIDHRMASYDGTEQKMQMGYVINDVSHAVESYLKPITYYECVSSRWHISFENIFIFLAQTGAYIPCTLPIVCLTIIRRKNCFSRGAGCHWSRQKNGKATTPENACWAMSPSAEKWKRNIYEMDGGRAAHIILISENFPFQSVNYHFDVRMDARGKSTDTRQRSFACIWILQLVAVHLFSTGENCNLQFGAHSRPLANGSHSTAIRRDDGRSADRFTVIRLWIGERNANWMHTRWNSLQTILMVSIVYALESRK